ncbi:amidohydrolase [Dialister micraerophilus]|uniref:Peptidase n=1 Tax=Dialister micraerophilus DSM 19965 TaxID=888062 RepID=F2BXN1_9FIRM|nr:amidohydrolase [Dialister micraerophilus]EGF13302.1 peptidase [Dialister micraerophilus DSM 19965]
MELQEKLIKMLEKRKDEMIQIRRHLHENPEVSFHETETAKYIAKFYEGKDVEIHKNIAGKNGIVVTIKGGKSGKTIGIRADFDALPIKEETGLFFASKNEGVMHACGHDGHTAYLMILADCLIKLKDEIKGTIKIIHQNAEEMAPGGAKDIVESGLLDDMEEIYGIHLLPDGAAGTVGWHKGYSFTGRSYMKLEIKGVGGHGSSPHLANDAIVAGAYFITQAQTVISRRLNPFDVGVITIGSFDGKGQFNIIKESVELEGDIRCMSNEGQKLIGEELEKLAKGIETGFGVKCKLTYKNDYSPLYNDIELTEKVVKILEKAAKKDKDIKEVKEFPPQAPSEDFSYYNKICKGCYFFIAAAPKNVKKVIYNHNPKFDIDEDALLVAAKSVAYIVTEKMK